MQWLAYYRKAYRGCALHLYPENGGGGGEGVGVGGGGEGVGRGWGGGGGGRGWGGGGGGRGVEGVGRGWGTYMDSG